MQIIFDQDKCTGIGLCESFAAEVFEIDDDGALIIHGEAVTEDRRDALMQAVDGCPTNALRLVES